MARWSFGAIVVFVALWPIAFAQAERVGDRPLFTAGFMSDTHVKPAPGSCDRVRVACEFFKAKGISLIANLGDIAELHCPDAYRAYRQVRETVYPDVANRPKEVVSVREGDADAQA